MTILNIDFDDVFLAEAKAAAVKNNVEVVDQIKHWAYLGFNEGDAINLSNSNNSVNVDPLKIELAMNTVNTLKALYSNEKYKTNDLALKSKYEKKMGELKKVIQFLVTANNNEADTITAKYSKIYREKRKI